MFNHEYIFFIMLKYRENEEKENKYFQKCYLYFYIFINLKISLYLSLYYYEEFILNHI